MNPWALSSMSDLIDASKCQSLSAERYHGQRFEELSMNKREQEKKYCMNIYLCGYVHFIYVHAKI